MDFGDYNFLRTPVYAGNQVGPAFLVDLAEVGDGGHDIAAPLFGLIFQPFQEVSQSWCFAAGES